MQICRFWCNSPKHVINVPQTLQQLPTAILTRNFLQNEILTDIWDCFLMYYCVGWVSFIVIPKHRWCIYWNVHISDHLRPVHELRQILLNTQTLPSDNIGIKNKTLLITLTLIISWQAKSLKVDSQFFPCCSRKLVVFYKSNLMIVPLTTNPTLSLALTQTTTKK